MSASSALSPTATSSVVVASTNTFFAKYKDKCKSRAKHHATICLVLYVCRVYRDCDDRVNRVFSLP